MNEKTLLKLALIMTVTGLLILFFISETIEPKEKPLSQINKENIDAFVKLTGTITSVASKEKVTFIQINKQETAQVILFDNISLSRGDKVEIIGKITEYNGKLEVIAQQVRVID